MTRKPRKTREPRKPREPREAWSEEAKEIILQVKMMFHGLSRREQIEIVFRVLNANGEGRPWASVKNKFDKMKSNPENDPLLDLKRHIYTRHNVEGQSVHTLPPPPPKTPETIVANQWSPGEPPVQNELWDALCLL